VKNSSSGVRADAQRVIADHLGPNSRFRTGNSIALRQVATVSAPKAEPADRSGVSEAGPQTLAAWCLTGFLAHASGGGQARQSALAHRRPPVWIEHTDAGLVEPSPWHRWSALGPLSMLRSRNNMALVKAVQDILSTAPITRPATCVMNDWPDDGA